MTESLSSSSTSVFTAAYEGRLDLLRRMVQVKSEAVVRSKDEDLREPLHWAVMGGHLDVVEYLVETMACPVQIQDESQWTPLHIAASAGREPVLRFLLDHGADVNVHNENGQTPLHYAASKDHVECTRLLLQHGADPTLVDAQKQTAIHRAAGKGNLRVLKAMQELLPVGTLRDLVNQYPDSSGNTALHLACEEGHGEVARLLVSGWGATAALQRLNRDKQTPLDLCATPGLRAYLERELAS